MYQTMMFVTLLTALKKLSKHKKQLYGLAGTQVGIRIVARYHYLLRLKVTKACRPSDWKRSLISKICVAIAGIFRRIILTGTRSNYATR